MAKRSYRPRKGSQRRSGRNVWVNENINSVPVGNSLGIIDCLTAAQDFMTFDTTIQRIVIPAFNWAFLSDATVGMREIRFALEVGKATLDAADFTSLFSDNIGPPWMYTWGRSIKINGAAAVTVDFSNAGVQGGPIDVKSKRRFRENESTLFLVNQNLSPGTDVEQSINGLVRTLLYIP